MSVPQPRRRMGSDCSVHRHRELVPIEVHHVWPLGYGGPDAAWNKVPLCANAHSSVHYYLEALRKTGGKPPWPYRRRFGKGVRAVAELGYQRMREGGES